MASPTKPSPEPPLPPPAILHQPPSPRFPPTGGQRKIAIAVDLSDESAYAVKWAVHNYLRPGDSVVLLHVRPTSVLYGADWGAFDDKASPQKLEDEFDRFIVEKTNELSLVLIEGGIPFKVRTVKDHDMKERLCLEVERLGLGVVIMGSRGFGASKGRLGRVSDYCVRHCVCPVVVVRYPEEMCAGSFVDGDDSVKGVGMEDSGVLESVPEEETEY